MLWTSESTRRQGVLASAAVADVRAESTPEHALEWRSRSRNGLWIDGTATLEATWQFVKEVQGLIAMESG